MKQAYRWDVTGALNIVKFRTRFASNKRQLQRMSTTLKVNAAAPFSRRATRVGAPHSESDLRRIFFQNEMWLSQEAVEQLQE